jgi:ABC-type lipoprotein export system ATPase subunit
VKPVITTKDLSFSYETDKKKVEVLKNIDLSLFPGDRVAILGGSGSGKTTLLNTLALLATGKGRITRLQGSEYTLKDGRLTTLKKERSKSISKDKLRQRFGFVFQTAFMLGNFNALYNIGLSLRQQGISEAIIKKKAKEMAEYLELTDKKQQRSADGLSGGERQRVAIGRALLHQPDVVFADEPTGNLDDENAIKTMELFKNRCEEMKTTLILVTHNLSLAETYAENIFRLTDNTLVENT